VGRTSAWSAPPSVGRGPAGAHAGLSRAALLSSKGSLLRYRLLQAVPSGFLKPMPTLCAISDSCLPAAMMGAREDPPLVSLQYLGPPHFAHPCRLRSKHRSARSDEGLGGTLFTALHKRSPHPGGTLLLRPSHSPSLSGTLIDP
jgi:hypothetical protein